MTELKKLSNRDLTLLRSVKQFGHQIGYMFNIILRGYDGATRYKCRQNLRIVLDGIDKRLSLFKCQLNHNGGAIVSFYNNLPRTVDSSLGLISISYVDKNNSETSFRWMEDYDMRYVIHILYKIRKRLIDVYKFDKTKLPKFKGNDHTVVVYKYGNINYLDSEYHQKDFEKYITIYNALIDSPLLQSFYPEIKFEEGVMKFYDGKLLLYYVDPKEKMIVSLDAFNQGSTEYLLRPKELNRIIKNINSLINGGIA